MNRLALEVVAEGEIAQHLEECVMPGGVADVLEVVVFAAGAHAALAGDGAQIVALLLAEKHVLELHHAGIGKQQRRVIGRHERTRGHDHMTLFAEELQEGAAHVGRAHVRRFAQALQSRSGSAPVAARI